MQGFVVALLSLASSVFAQAAPAAPLAPTAPAVPGAPSASSTPHTIVIINPMGVSGYAAGSTLEIVWNNMGGTDPTWESQKLTFELCDGSLGANKVTAVGVTLGTARVQDLQLSVQIPATVAAGNSYCVRADLQGAAGFTYFFSPIFPITAATAGSSSTPPAGNSSGTAPGGTTAAPHAVAPNVALPSTDTITVISPMASQSYNSGEAIQIVWNNNGDTKDSVWLNTQVTFEIADASQGPNKVNPIGITLGTGMVKDLFLNAKIPANAPTGGAFCIRAGFMSTGGFIYAFSPNFSMNGGTAVVVASGGAAATASAMPKAATVSTTSGAKMNAAGILSAMIAIAWLF
ncbi:hypothetical protein HDU98_010920 [Podochytrium sp. JEL0797]|nr:hypothetical protein HDU98_010920 [Podochytrium sp. JEL0797]